MSYHRCSAAAGRGAKVAAIALLAVLATSGRARAGLTLLSSSGQVDYGVYQTTTVAVPGSPSFDPNHELIYPGGSLPALLAPLPEAPTQVTNGPLNPALISVATSIPSSPNGFVPASFGAATTDVYAASSGQQGSFTSQGGVFWSLNTNLMDGLTAGSHRASVSLSIATAIFTNFTGGNVTINPGAILSIQGTLGSLDGGSSIAAGLSSYYTVSGAGVASATTNLDSIVLATNGIGTNIASKGSGANEFASVSVVGNQISGTGTSLNPTSVTLINDESITITAFLTLISDPGSSIGITTDLPSTTPFGPLVLPDFGGFAASTPLASVPEPSTVVLLVAGLAMAALHAWSTRRRSARISGVGGVREIMVSGPLAP